MEQYKKNIMDKYINKNNIYIPFEFLEPVSKGWSKSTFLNYDQKKSTTYFETKQLNKIIDSLLLDISLPENYGICDIGCADGRIIQLLLKRDLHNIVGIDINYPALERLVKSIDLKNYHKFFCICEDLLKIDLNTQFDLVFVWGICSLTPNFEKSFSKALELVKKGGHILFAEPLLEQKLLYALVRNDIKEFIKIFEQKTRPFIWEDRNKEHERYPLKPLRFYKDFIEKQEICEIVKTGHISSLPSLIYGGLFQDHAFDEEIHSKLENILTSEELGYINLPRQQYWILKRVN